MRRLWLIIFLTAAAGVHVGGVSSVSAAAPTERHASYAVALEPRDLLRPDTEPVVPHSDFNGDGYADMAFGVPYEDIGSASDAGGVEVLYGSAASPQVLTAVDSQWWTQNSSGINGEAEKGDKFGSALAAGDFDGDGYDDLAVGVPGEDVQGESITNAGAVEVIYGSASGLSSTGDQQWTQDSTGVEDQAEKGDKFGSALAVGNFPPPPPIGCDPPGLDDLAVGVPYEDLSSSKTGAGAVNILFSTTGGLDGCRSEFWTQDSDGVPGQAEAGDHFGASLAAGHFDDFGIGLAIGVPDEDLGDAIDAGGVNVLEAYAFGLIATDEFWTEDFGDVTGDAETGDHFGFSLAATDFYQVICCGDPVDDLAIGVYGQDTQTGADVGAVHILSGDETDQGLMDYGQEYFTPAVEQAGAKYGYALAAGTASTSRFLAIGAPYMDVGGVSDAGQVEIQGFGTGIDAEWTQDSSNILDQSEEGDRFGWSLASSSTTGTYRGLLAIGVSREDVGSIANAGAANVIYTGSFGFVTTDNQFWNQDSPDVGNTAEEGDRFGEAVG